MMVRHPGLYGGKTLAGDQLAIYHPQVTALSMAAVI